MAKKTRSKRNPRKVDTCEQATSLLMDYLSGEMDPERANAFEDHLSICPDCIAFINTYKKTIHAIRGFLNKSSLKTKSGMSTPTWKNIGKKVLRSVK